MVREIADRIVVCEEELRDLSPTRQTPEQQRRYLLGIVTKFQEITTFVVEAQYGRHQLLQDNRNMRLTTLIVDFNSAFSEDLEKRGYTVNFCESKFPSGKSRRKPKSMSFRKLKFKGYLSMSFPEKQVGEGQNEGSSTVESLEYSELLNVLSTTSNCSLPLLENTMGWIEREYKSLRGFELGTFNSSILLTLFQELSTK